MMIITNLEGGGRIFIKSGRGMSLGVFINNRVNSKV